jgi:hypothetical protein
LHLIQFRYPAPSPEAELAENQPSTLLTWIAAYEVPPTVRDYVAHQQNLFRVISRRPLSFAESARQRSPEMHGLAMHCSVSWIKKLSERPIADDEQQLLDALDNYL